MIIYLIGMPGCGKSKTARYLKEHRDYKIIDLDEYIEETTKKTIESLIKEGEINFRLAEHKALEEITNNYKDVIVSCGGGIITFPSNNEVMKKGLTVFLNASLELIKEHISSSSNPRPLLKKKTVEQIYNERINLYYEFADVVIDYIDYITAADEIEKIMKRKKILVINGPNLNMLGLRDANHYGVLTLDKINEIVASDKSLNFEFFQSNWEGAIVDKIQEYKNYDGLIINPAAYTHTSVAIHDALEIVDIPKVEVHLSKVDEREEYRKVNFIRDVVDVCFQGEKEQSYVKAVEYLKNKLNVL